MNIGLWFEANRLEIFEPPPALTRCRRFHPAHQMKFSEIGVAAPRERSAPDGEAETCQAFAFLNNSIRLSASRNGRQFLFPAPSHKTAAQPFFVAAFDGRRFCRLAAPTICLSLLLLELPVALPLADGGAGDGGGIHGH